jgi:two-component system, chemotaxis family, CheB/CheR fusion protein
MRLKGTHVLVVEDSADMLEILATLLRLEGAEPAEAANGRDALSLFLGRHFDVVLSDLDLPDIPGDVLIRAIVAAARHPVEVVVITGASEPFVARARAAGAGAVFAKPCDWRHVVRYLEGLAVAA